MEKSMEGSFTELEKVVDRLRGECPWDSVQTFESLQTCLLEETREVQEGIRRFQESADAANLCEELGDLLFLITLYGTIAKEKGLFSMEDVIAGASSKMKYRHPKIFSPGDAEAAAMTWEELKEKEHCSKMGKNP